MENSWEKFKQMADEKVEARVARIEIQLDCQQDLINKLTERLQGLVRSVQGQASVKKPVKDEKLKDRPDNQVKKTESSDKDEE